MARSSNSLDLGLGTDPSGPNADGIGSDDYPSIRQNLTRGMEEKDLPGEFLMLHGHPATANVQALTEAGTDMLIMESPGHRGADDPVFG